MFFAKKLISALLAPTSLFLLLLGVGVALLWFGRRTRAQLAGRILVTTAFGLLMVTTSHAFSDAFNRPLERYPALYPRAALDAALAQAGKPPRIILVLGGGDVADPRVPPNDQLSDSGLSRLIEGIRLLRELPGTRLILSGGYGRGIKHADRLGAVAAMMGVKDEEMELDRTAWDTEQEAANIARRIGGDPFVLVTSAFHMPRAAALFRKAGANPIPAPTHHITLDSPGVHFLNLFPDPQALAYFETGLHEYLGMLWSRLRGRI
jgi:uncharacterized SAM-binding protein YcdF (DUF218 family)